MGPQSARSYPGRRVVKPAPPKAQRAKQEIDYGRRGKGYVIGSGGSRLKANAALPPPPNRTGQFPVIRLSMLLRVLDCQGLRPVVLVRYRVASAYPPYYNSGCTSTTALYPVSEASRIGRPIAFGRVRPSADGCPRRYPWHLANMAALSPCGSWSDAHLGDPVITRIRRCDAHRCLVRPFDLIEDEQAVSAGQGTSGENALSLLFRITETHPKSTQYDVSNIATSSWKVTS